MEDARTDTVAPVEGTRYVMRNGDVTGPMTRREEEEAIWFSTSEWVDNLLPLWEPDGSAVFFHEDGPFTDRNRKYDLIREAPMRQEINSFPGLKKAALLIARDNGMINRMHSEEQFLAECDEVVGADGVDFADLAKMDKFLQSLGDDQMDDLCCGEEGEGTAQAEVLALWEDIGGDRNMLNDLLNDIFEGVPAKEGVESSPADIPWKSVPGDSYENILTELFSRMPAIANGNCKGDPDCWPDEEGFMTEFGDLHRRFKGLKSNPSS